MIAAGTFRVAGSSRHRRDGRQAHTDAAPVPGLRLEQAVREGQVLRQPEQAGQLPGCDYQRDAGQVPGHHLVGNELDQLARAQQPQPHLQQRGNQRGERKQPRQPLPGQAAFGHEPRHHRREHRGGRRAGSGDEAAIAAHQRRDDAQHRGADDAAARRLPRARAGGLYTSTPKAIAEASPQHRGEPAPESPARPAGGGRVTLMLSVSLGVGMHNIARPPHQRPSGRSIASTGLATLWRGLYLSCGSLSVQGACAVPVPCDHVGAAS